MSMPTLPESNNPSREEAVNLILTSIAMEELGLSHIINAEGEKLQYALGTLEGTTGPGEPLTIDDLLSLNKSVRDTLSLTMQNQLFLSAKMGSAMSIPTMQGPPGPQGPQGPVGVILGSYNSLDELIAAHEIGNQGDSYLVGGDLYAWNVNNEEWVLVGNLQGPTGPMGPRGFDGPEGPPGPQGEQGIQGEAGTVGTIRGSYESETDLREAHPEGGEPGEFYYINPDLWVWDDVQGDWLNVGQIAGPQGIQGVQGERGESGPVGPIGPVGTILGSFDTVDALRTAHPTGNQGEAYLVGGDLYVWNEVLETWEIVGTLIGPAGPPGAPVDAHNFNLSASGSFGEVTVGNIIFTLANVNSTTISLSIRPASTAVMIDFARSTIYNLLVASVETQYQNNYRLATTLTVDSSIYSDSNEQQKSWLRQQNPNGTWSLCEYSIFASNGGARVTLWINWIYRDL